MFILTGRIFTINEISPKVIQIVLKKQVRGKQTAIAIDVVGFWKDKADALKLKKNDKIKGRVYVNSNLYKNKWYSNLYFRDIERCEEKPKQVSRDSGDGIIGDVKHFFDADGNVLL